MKVTTGGESPSGRRPIFFARLADHPRLAVAILDTNVRDLTHLISPHLTSPQSHHFHCRCHHVHPFLSRFLRRMALRELNAEHVRRSLILTIVTVPSISIGPCLAAFYFNFFLRSTMHSDQHDMSRPGDLLCSYALSCMGYVLRSQVSRRPWPFSSLK